MLRARIGASSLRLRYLSLSLSDYRVFRSRHTLSVSLQYMVLYVASCHTYVHTHIHITHTVHYTVTCTRCVVTLCVCVCVCVCVPPASHLSGYILEGCWATKQYQAQGLPLTRGPET